MKCNGRMKCNGILLFACIFFLNLFLSIKAVFADSTVSVATNTVYNITGENYGVELGRTLSGRYGRETTLYIDGLGFPQVTWAAFRRMEFLNSSYKRQASGTTFLDSHPVASQIVESGPSRVVIHFENKTNNICLITPEVICINYTADYYLYPRKYFVVYNISGNFTGLKIGGAGFSSYFFNRLLSTLPNNFIYYGAVQNLQGTLTASGGLFPSGTYTFPTTVGYNSSYLFAWNESHTKAVATAGTFSGFAKNNPYFNVLNSVNYTIMRIISVYSATGPATFFNATNVSWGWMNWVGNSGGGDLTINHTVNDELNDTYLDFHYPADVNVITGTYQNLSKITGTYNFTASSNRVDFNFSLGSYSRTYPAFHIQNLTGISSIKDYVYWKNYTAGNSWEQLTNYTDFVIQSGNSTYFGYDYVLVLMNNTYTPSDSAYEFWISNSSEPVPPQWFDNSTNNTLAGQPTLFSLNWTDNVGLSGYIFSTNNSGTWVNDSWQSMTGTESWSNVTKTLNSTIGSIVQWRVYANDTSNNWNASLIYNLTSVVTMVPVRTLINKGNAYSLSLNSTHVIGYINNQPIAATFPSGWVHVALTYDGSNQKLYVNGKVVSSQSLIGSINSNTENLIVGNLFNGKIDEIRIYNKALI